MNGDENHDDRLFLCPRADRPTTWLVGWNGLGMLYCRDVSRNKRGVVAESGHLSWTAGMREKESKL